MVSVATEREWWKDPQTATLRPGSRPATAVAEWVWVDVTEPDTDSLRRLAERFAIDPVALEDGLDSDLFAGMRSSTVSS